MKYYVYTDGSCKGNGTNHSVGAWGYVILDENENIIYEESKAFNNVTNNQMEMQAILAAAQKVEELDTNYEEMYLFTDSAYCHNCLAQKWYKKWQTNAWLTSKKEPVLNKELWEKLIPYFENFKFFLMKVKGHSTNKWNNYVDKKAQSAAEALKGGVK